MADESKETGKQQKCTGIACACPECGGRKRKESEQKDKEAKLGKAIIG